MAIVNKTMHKFNVVHDGNTISYEIVDKAGRKMAVQGWADNSAKAFAAGEYVEKDGKLYKFKTSHAAGSAWNASEVEETNIGSELSDLKSADKEVKMELDKKANIFAPVIHNDYMEEVKTLENCADNMGMGVEIPINPVQDLHGYSFPWVGGAGKNLLPCLLSSIKSNNTGGTWNEDTYSLYGIDFKFNTQDGYVTSVEVSGTATANSTVRVYADSTGLPAGSYIANGCPSGGTSTTYYLRLYNVNSSSGGTAKFEYGNGVSVDDTYTIKRVNISVDNGNTVSGLVFKPMVRLSTETDATFVPYSNICPISGFTGVDITRTGRNLANPADKRNGQIIVSTNGTIQDNTSHMAYVGFIPVKPLASYTLSAVNIHNRGNSDASNAVVNVVEYSDTDRATYLRKLVNSSTNDTSYTFTISPDAHYIRFSVGNGASNVQLEIGENVTEYTPFVGCDQFNVSFPSEAGTVYGGTLTINEDGSGKLVVDKNVFLIDDRTVIFDADNTNPAFRVQYAGRKTGNVVYNTKCSHFSYYGTGTSGGLMAGTANGQYGIQTTTTWIMFKDDSIAKNPTYSTSEEKISAFTTKYSDMQLYVNLSSAVEYDLTPQQITSLLGTNTTWNSIGAFKCSYHLDPKVYVDDTAGIAGSIAKSDSTEASVKTLSDGADNLPMDVSVAINLVQDLHGYGFPWVGGAGKNLANPSDFIGVRGATATIDGNEIRVVGDGSNTYQSARVNIETKTYTAGTYYVKFKIKGTPVLTESSKVALRTSSGVIKASTAIVSGTSEYSDTWTIADDCYLTILTNGSTSGESYAGDITVYDLIVSTTDVPFEPYVNVCPIIGWDSVKISAPNKNLNSGIEAGGIDTSDGQNNDSANNVYRTKDKIRINAGGTYTISGIKTATGTIRLFYYDSNKEYLSNETASAANNVITKTFGSTVSYIRFQGGSTVIDADAHIQIEAGSVATEYEPFRCFNISLPQTTYGGTLTINKDGSGTLAVDLKNYLFNGSENWIYSSSSSVFAYQETNAFDNSRQSDVKSNLFSDVSVSTSYIRVPISDFGGSTDVSAFKTWLTSNNLQVVAPMLAPITIDFTAQQIRSILGLNTLYADSGNVLNVAYYADTKMYIDNLFSTIIPATGVSF